MRQPIIAGNWKMYKTGPESRDFIKRFKSLVEGVQHCEIVISPPFTSLALLGPELTGTGISLGAQSMHWEAQGAYTGEISPLMLKAAGCKYVILGHSERREYFGESDEIINRKIKAAMQHGLIPIFCVGEKLEEREAGITRQVIETKLTGGLQGLNGSDAGGIVIAYEPVWAIGTGKTASANDAEEVIKFIREVLGRLYDVKVAQQVRIQYGGSVKPDNAAELMAMPNIDGALVGGASLEPDSFAQIVKYQRPEVSGQRSEG